MGYQHIDNLYKNQEILKQPEVYALEKIHGTSAHIAFERIQDEVTFRLFSGGEKHARFEEILTGKLLTMVDAFRRITDTIISVSKCHKMTVYGELYGGKCQGMSATYGPDLKFVAFEVCLDQDTWLNIPDAHDIAKELGIEFVYYARIPTDLSRIDAERDAPSVQAARNGITTPCIREGVVLFPLQQQRDHRGNRLFAKHKRDEFRETKSPRVVTEVPLVQINAEKAAAEWVTPMRLAHVLDKLPGHDIKQMVAIMTAMTEDVLREGVGEVVDTPQLRKAINHKTALTYKEFLKNNLLRVALP